MKHVAKTKQNTVAAWFMRWRFALLLGSTFFYFHQGADPNQVTRFALVRAIVERHDVDITPDHAQTIDKGFHSDRFYSDKAPGLSLVLTPLYAAMTKVDRLVGHDPRDRGVERARLHILSWAGSGLPAVLAALCVFRTLLLFGSPSVQARFLAGAYALGTLVFPFATAMFGHVLAALTIVTAFYLLQKWRVELAPITLLRAALLGFLWALSIVIEYPTGLLVAIMGLYALSLQPQWRSMLRLLGGSILGALLPFLAHATFAKLAYDSWAALPYNFIVDPMWLSNTSSGILGIGIPSKIGAWGALVSPYRGLFYLCPYLALVFAGWFAWFRTGSDRRELWVVTILMLAYGMFDVSYYAWDGGGSTGSRHIIPALSFIVFAVGAYARSSQTAWRITIGLVIPSIVIMYVFTAVLVQLPEGSALEENPLYEIILPNLFRGEIHSNLQDAFYPRHQADAAYNVGTLLGMPALPSLLLPPLFWAVAYLPPILRHRLVGS